MANVQKVLDAINKRLGRNAAHFMHKDFVREVKAYSTGSLTLDLALGIGGFPQGRIIEIFGPAMGGKSTLATIHIGQVQKQLREAGEEGYCAWIDAEHTFDPKLAAQYGVDVDNLIYMEPLAGEEAIDTIDALIRSGSVRTIVVDSVAALAPAKIIESSSEQQTIGLLARFMSNAMAKLVGIASLHQCTLIFINQLREKVGAYGNPETTTGGRALPYYSSVRLRVTMGDQMKRSDGTVYGHEMKVRVVKNKLAVPFKEANFPLIYGVGVDKVDETVQLALFGQLIRQSGAWFSYDDPVTGEPVERNGVVYRWQGRNKLVEFVRNNPMFLMELEDRLRGKEIEAPTGEPVLDMDGYE